MNASHPLNTVRARPIARSLAVLCFALATLGTAPGALGAGQTGPLSVDPALIGRPAVRPAGAAPTLDVAALKERLRDTNAIGMFTKLALKNQMDDLIEQFRAHYDGGLKTDIALLRQPYNMLVLKVLALLQDGDPSLARTIADSREAIWVILTDPQKFRLIVGVPGPKRTLHAQASTGDVS